MFDDFNFLTGDVKGEVGAVLIMEYAIQDRTGESVEFPWRLEVSSGPSNDEGDELACYKDILWRPFICCLRIAVLQGFGLRVTEYDWCLAALDDEIHLACRDLLRRKRLLRAGDRVQRSPNLRAQISKFIFDSSNKNP